MLRAEDEEAVRMYAQRGKRGKNSQRKGRDPEVKEGPRAVVSTVIERGRS